MQASLLGFFPIATYIFPLQKGSPPYRGGVVCVSQ